MVDNNIFQNIAALSGANSLYNPTPVNPSERLINLVDDTGKFIGSAPESKVNDYIKQGYHIESSSQKKLNDYIEDNSGITGALKTADAYANNEATFGLGKELYKATQSDQDAATTESHYQALGAANPVSAGLGTAAGFAASLALGSPLFKGAAELGKLAEGAVTAGRTAEELGLGTRLLSKAAGGAAENAAAGAALSAPTAINDIRQGNPGEAAEAVLVNAGLGALFGGALSTAGVGAKAGLAKLGGVDSLEKFSTDQTIRSLIHSTDNISIKMIDKLEKQGISKSELAAYVKQNNLFRTLKGSYEEDVIPRLDELKDNIGKQIEAKQDALLINNVEGPKLNVFFKQIDDEVVKPLMENGATRGKARQLTTQLKDFYDALLDNQAQRAAKEGLNLTEAELVNQPISMSTLNNQRIALDKVVHQHRLGAATGDLNAMEEELSKVAGIYRDTVNTYGEKALGDEWRSELGGLNKQYQMISTLNKVAERSSIAEQRNQQFALKDIIIGSGFLGHPGGIPLSLASSFGTKVLRKKGNQWLAAAADYTNNALINAANTAIDEKIATIPKILNNAASGPGLQAGSNSLVRLLDNLGVAPNDSNKNKEVAAFNTFADLLSNQVTSHDNHITTAAKAINNNDPAMAASLNNSSATVINYLNQQIPKAPTAAVPFQQPWQPTPQQIKEFTAKAAVAADPFIVMDKLGDGSLNQNHVQALKALYPNIYSKLVNQIKIEGMKKNAAKLPYNKKLQLSLLLNEPLDPSIANIQSLQASYQKQDQQASMPEGKLENVPGSEPTEMQKVQNDLPA